MRRAESWVPSCANPRSPPCWRSPLGAKPARSLSRHARAMLFNSYEFVFLFFPITAVLYFLIGHYSNRLGAAWLAGASLFFYGYWNPIYVPLLLASIAANYLVGRSIAAAGS